MVEAKEVETPQGKSIYGVLFSAVAEGFAGNGILSVGDARVTVSDPSAGMGIDVAAASGGIRYDGATRNPGSASFTLSDGPTSTTNGVEDRRVDIVYWNDATTAFETAEGTPDPSPVPPSLPADGLLLAVVDVGHGVTNIVDEDVINWKAHPTATYPVGDAEIQADAVGTSELKNDAVTTPILADNSVTSAAIADDAVGSSEVASAAIDTAQMVDGAVTTAKLGDGSVTTAKLGDGSVTNAKLDSGVSTTITVEDNTVQVRGDVETINFGNALTVTDDGSGKVTVGVDEAALGLGGGDPVLAQMLSRRRRDIRASKIQADSGVSAPKAQVLSRRRMG